MTRTEQLRQETIKMAEEIKPDLVKWVKKYGFAQLGPLLMGFGMSMIDQSGGPGAVKSMLRDVMVYEATGMIPSVDDDIEIDQPRGDAE